MSDAVSQPLLGPRYQEALLYSTELHNTQTRKGTSIPYVSHVIAVSSLVLEAGGDEDEAIAALLHDGPEDQGGEETLREINTRFGDKVSGIVAECSDTFEEPKPPWKNRKLAYIEHLKTATPSARLVSCCDKLHNARAILNDYLEIGDALWDRFNAGKEGTLWYYQEVVSALASATPPPGALPLLKRTVNELLERVHDQ